MVLLTILSPVINNDAEGGSWHVLLSTQFIAFILALPTLLWAASTGNLVSPK